MDKSDKNFAYSFLPLEQADGTVLANQPYTLALFKWDKRRVTGSDAYLREEVDPADRTRDTFTIKSLFCSTRLTQHVELLRLLQWRNAPANELATIMKDFTFIGDLEIMKFLQDIFDALFNILDAKKNSELQLAEPFFAAILFILNKISDRRFTQFRPMLDAYIEQHFGGAMTYVHLVGALKKQLRDFPHYNEMIPALKSLEYLFKFIVQSRSLQRKQDRKAAKAQNEALFRQELSELFQAFNDLMSQNEDKAIGAQALALQNFPLIFKELVRDFEPKELVMVAMSFVDSIKNRSHKIVEVKLAMLQTLVKSAAFSSPESRAILTSLSIMQLAGHLDVANRENFGRCVATLADMLSLIQKSGDFSLVTKEVFGLLPRLFEAYPIVSAAQREAADKIALQPRSRDREDPLRELVVCIACIFELISAKEFVDFARDQEGDWLRETVSGMLQTMTSFLTEKVFPDQWQMLHLSVIIAVVKAANMIRPVLDGHVALSEPTNRAIWASWITAVSRVASHPSLQLDRFSPFKERRILRFCSRDMRHEAVALVQSCWASLGPHQSEFVAPLIGPALEMTLLSSTWIHTRAMALLFAMMSREFESRGTLRDVEVACIVKIDEAINQGDIDDDIGAKFVAAMEAQLSTVDSGAESGADSELYKAVEEVLRSLEKLLELLLNVRSLPTSQEFEDERVMGLVRLMNFMKKTNKTDRYIRYVHELADLHIASQNFTEAAFALSLHADLITWTDDVIEEEVGMPRQSSFDRKEMIVGKMIEYFDRGKAWEEAIRASKMVEDKYENLINRVDYNKVRRKRRREGRRRERKGGIIGIWYHCQYHVSIIWYHVSINVIWCQYHVSIIVSMVSLAVSLWYHMVLVSMSVSCQYHCGIIWCHHYGIIWYHWYQYHWYQYHCQYQCHFGIIWYHMVTLSMSSGIIWYQYQCQMVSYGVSLNISIIIGIMSVSISVSC